MFYGNKVGIGIWVFVFVTCITLMSLQLKNVFSSYHAESVGTRVAEIVNTEHIESPSVVYCNPIWMPLPDAVERLVRCNASSSETAKVCYGDYEVEAGTERLVDAVIMPRNPHINRNSGRDRSPAGGDGPLGGSVGNGFPGGGGGLPPFLKPGFKSKREVGDGSPGPHGSSLFETVNEKHSGSLAAYVRESVQVHPGAVATSGHGVIQLSKTDATQKFLQNYQIGDDVENELRQRGGDVALTMNGVCWKFGLPNSRLKHVLGMGEKNLHVVLHLGAYLYDLQRLVQMLGIDSDAEFHYLFKTVPSRLLYTVKKNVASGMQQGIYNAIGSDPTDFATFASIARKDESNLFFGNRVLLNHRHLKMNIKFWTKKNIYQNRRRAPCRDWTSLDQAHCNQDLENSKGSLTCVHYLTRSPKYDEIPFKEDLCQRTYDSSKAPEVDYEVVVGNLAKNNRKCPRPCSKFSYGTSIVYEEPSFIEEIVCVHAIAAAFYPEETKDKMQKRTKELGGIYNSSSGIPCTIVEYQQDEGYGLVYEEYPLYTLADLASNVGGTIGLWMGASVISFVQLVYYWWFEKFLKREESIEPDDDWM